MVLLPPRAMSVHDLEYGSLSVSAGVEKIISYLHSRKLKRLGMVFLATTLLLLVKSYFSSVETMCEEGTGYTLDEEPYAPFRLAEDPVPGPVAPAKRFPLKTSHVNLRMQQMNLEQEGARARTLLRAQGFPCIHARHLGVPYDILFFENVTMVNPMVDNYTEEERFVHEMDLSGVEHVRKRHVGLRIRFMDAQLSSERVEWIWGAQSVCFAHYEFD